MLTLKGTVLEICFQQRQITWGQRCASLQSHGQAIHCGAIQILALPAFVCFPFSIDAVLGNCKQHQHSPEIKLPQSHALLKALRLSQKSTAFFAFFPFFFRLITCWEMFVELIGISLSIPHLFVKENNLTFCVWLNCFHPNPRGRVCHHGECEWWIFLCWDKRLWHCLKPQHCAPCVLFEHSVHQSILYSHLCWLTHRQMCCEVGISI